MPGDALPPGGNDSYRHVGEACEVLFTDGLWHTAMLLCWRRDRLGRQVAQVEFHADGSTWIESYLYSPEKMREISDSG